MAEFKTVIVSLAVILLSVQCFGQLPDLCGSKLRGCYCTTAYIDCKEADFTDITEIYPYITRQTRRIHITDGNIGWIPDNVFTSDLLPGPLDQVKYLNLSGNNIVTISERAFDQIQSLTVLDLSNNDISVDQCNNASAFSTLLSPLINVEELYLGHLLSSEVVGVCDPGIIFSRMNMSKLTKLDISLNNFEITEPRVQNLLCESILITSLNLSGNNFYHFPVLECMTNLQQLDVSHNRIANLSPVEIDIIESLVNLKELRLSGNPFDCDCMFEKTLGWIKTTDMPLDSDQILCENKYHSVQLQGPIKSLNYTDMCEEPQIIICYGPQGPVAVAKSTFIAIIAVGVILVITIITVIVICKRRRRRMGQFSRESQSTDIAKSPAYSRMV